MSGSTYMNQSMWKGRRSGDIPEEEVLRLIDNDPELRKYCDLLTDQENARARETLRWMAGEASSQED
jgi:hypothetical protein